jgi:hypothetical protein
MPHSVRISAGKVSLTAALNDTQTAEAIWEALPIEAEANRWGDEIYFEIPVHLEEADDARQDMAVGELGFWPVGSAFCIFFGPTPVSQGSQPRAYSNVNPFGKVEGDATVLRAVKDGSKVRIERALTSPTG